MKKQRVFQIKEGIVKTVFFKKEIVEGGKTLLPGSDGNISVTLSSWIIDPRKDFIFFERRYGKYFFSRLDAVKFMAANFLPFCQPHEKQIWEGKTAEFPAKYYRDMILKTGKYPTINWV